MKSEGHWALEQSGQLEPHTACEQRTQKKSDRHFCSPSLRVSALAHSLIRRFIFSPEPDPEVIRGGAFPKAASHPPRGGGSSPADALRPIPYYQCHYHCRCLCRYLSLQIVIVVASQMPRASRSSQVAVAVRSSQLASHLSPIFPGSLQRHFLPDSRVCVA